MLYGYITILLGVSDIEINHLMAIYQIISYCVIIFVLSIIIKNLEQKKSKGLDGGPPNKNLKVAHEMVFDFKLGRVFKAIIFSILFLFALVFIVPFILG